MQFHNIRISNGTHTSVVNSLDTYIDLANISIMCLPLFPTIPILQSQSQWDSIWSSEVDSRDCNNWFQHQLPSSSTLTPSHKRFCTVPYQSPQEVTLPGSAFTRGSAISAVLPSTLWIIVLQTFFLGRQRHPYIVFRNRVLYGFMFVTIYTVQVEIYYGEAIQINNVNK